jgi:hypothetical protein
MNENNFKRGYCDEYLDDIRSKVLKEELNISKISHDVRASLFTQDVEKHSIDYNTWNDSTRENIMTYVDDIFAKITDIVNIVEKHVNKGRALCIKWSNSLFADFGNLQDTNLPPIIVETPVRASILPEICILFDRFMIRYYPGNLHHKDTIVLNIFGYVDDGMINSAMYINLNENHAIIGDDDGSKSIRDLSDDNIIKKIVNDIMEEEIE